MGGFANRSFWVEVSAIVCGSAGAKPVVEPMELWQRLGHASYRDWVLALLRGRAA